MNMAKVVSDLKSLGQEQFLLLWASLYPPHPWMNPLARSLCCRIWGFACGSWFWSWFSCVTVLPPHPFCLWKGLWHVGILFFSPGGPSMPSTHSPSLLLLIIEVQSTTWVCCFPSPRVTDSQLIWRSSNHTVKRNILIKTKKKIYTNYSIGFLIKLPMTQQKMQFGLEGGRKHGAI